MHILIFKAGLPRVLLQTNRQPPQQRGSDRVHTPFLTWGRSAAGQATPSQRLGSAARQPTPLATSGVSRQQPLTRGLTPVGDRLNTQNGILSIPKTSHQGSGRIVQDRSFWIGELKQRIANVNNEINTIHSDISSFDREQSSLTTYENRAFSLTNELKELQGQLGDYNLLFDKLHTDNDLEQVQNSALTLSKQNAELQKSVDALFMDRQEKEQTIKQLEQSLSAIKESTFDKIISKLDPASQEKWKLLESENYTLQSDLINKQIQLTQLKTQKETLESKISNDKLKSQIWKLQSQKLLLQGKLGEIQSLNPPSNILTKEQILQEIKICTSQVTQLESQIANTERDLNQVLEETKSIQSNQISNEKAAKYEELVKKDLEMQDYLNSYPSNHESATIQLNELHKTHQALLNEIESLSLPPVTTTTDLAKLTTDLVDKDKELTTAESTMVHVHAERDRLLNDLSQMDSVDSKIRSQAESVKARIGELKLDLIKYARADDIKLDLTRARDKYLADLEEIQSRRDWARSSLSAQEAKLKMKQAQVNENETAADLANLVSTWKSLECSNHEIQVQITELSSKSDYSPVRERVLKLTDQCLEQCSKLVRTT